jgi:hypothetical protein
LTGSRLEHVFLGHLSAQNNETALALGAARQALARSGSEHITLSVVGQEHASPVLTLHD